MANSHSPQKEHEDDLLEIPVLESKLVVHNDHFNTFEWVIQTLMEVCKHNEEQAEQCSYIIHNKGKYAVKHGASDKLRPMKDAITERGIQATIE